jgi:hypothetical protein
MEGDCPRTDVQGSRCKPDVQVQDARWEDVDHGREYRFKMRDGSTSTTAKRRGTLATAARTGTSTVAERRGMVKAAANSGVGCWFF